MKRILVIRYGAFGDMMLSMAAFRTIRAHHATDEIAVLTTRPFVELLEASGYFDEVLVDSRPRIWQAPEWFRLARRLRARCFDRVYDLQRNQRTRILYGVMGSGRPLDWSGVIAGCSHPVRDGPDDRRHVRDKLAEQLRVAGIPEMLDPDISWLGGEVSRFRLPPAYALVVSGGALHRPEKRASAACFAGVAQFLLRSGIAPVLLGTASEREQIDEIRRGCDGAIDLSRQTSFGDIADLARDAVGAVGNDTGLMHLAAVIGCPSLVLFSQASDPALCAPRGRLVRILRAPDLNDLAAETVIAEAKNIFQCSSSAVGSAPTELAIP
jgi:ADP-heptose:LPS heptosyltransferase